MGVGVVREDGRVGRVGGRRRWGLPGLPWRRPAWLPSTSQPHPSTPQLHPSTPILQVSGYPGPATARQVQDRRGGGAVHGSGRGRQLAGPVIDVLWDALQESRGLAGPGVAGRAAPPQLRAARTRDLTRWNDRPGRRPQDVLRLMDLAVSRTIMAGVDGPGVDASRR
jgi:hypothetical protein